METQKPDCPAISVIIPLYNTEKYIGECLDSLLAQTFQNFEVIVVDDCSTDSSPAIVEKYAPKFNGRLKFVHMEKKSDGGGYLPRNKGVELSCGKYIFFLDSDDTVTSTAFEELYELAEKFAADVVHCEKFYTVPDELWHNAEFRKKLKPLTYLTGEKVLVKEPVMLDDKIEERLKFFSQKKIVWNIWAQLVRRDFILENNLKVPDAAAQDLTFTLCELCSAKRFLVVPNVVNCYRVRKNSVSTEKIDAPKLIHKWSKAVKCSVDFIDKFLSDIEIFSRRPDLKYIVLGFAFNELVEHLREVYAKVPAHALDELLRKEFAADNSVAFNVFTFSTMNLQRLQMIRLQRKAAVLENEMKIDRRHLTEAQKRIAALETELRRLKN